MQWILFGIISSVLFYVYPVIRLGFILFFVFFALRERSNYKSLVKFVISFAIILLSIYLRFDNYQFPKDIKGEYLVTERREKEDYSFIVVRDSKFNKFFFYDKEGMVKRGDRILLSGTISPLESRTMPLLYDERLTRYSQNIKAKINKPVYSVVGNSYLSILENIRQKGIEIFDSYLGENASKLSNGMLLRYEEDGELKELLSNAGISHILSVSGLHLGLIFGLAYFAFALFFPGLKLRLYISTIFIWLFGVLVGFTPSLLRAAIMISVSSVKMLYLPKLSNLQALAIAAIISLFVNPYYLFSVGFILSYLCMLGIIMVYPSIEPKLKLKKAFKYWVRSSFRLNISIFLATIPMILYFFNKYNILSILLNILLVPFFSLYLYLSVILLFISPLTFIANLLARFMSASVNLLIILLQFLTNSSFLIYSFSPHPLIIILYYLLIIIYLFKDKYNYLKTNIKRFTLTIMSLSLAASINIVFSSSDGVEFLDIGQGDAALISIGDDNYLIDSGGNGGSVGRVGKMILEPYLIKTGRRNIRAAFITHFDYDHVGGLTELTSAIKINEIIASHKPDNESEIMDKIKNLKINYLPSNTSYNLGKGYELHGIGFNDNNSLNENNRSQVFILKKDYNLVFFSADIEKEREVDLPNNIKSYILKVPHHGSNTSSTSEFLDKVNPKYAIISVGRNNLYGHPNDDVLNRLKSRDIDIYRTDKNGMIRFDLNNYSLYSFDDQKNNVKYLILIYAAIAFILVLTRREEWIIQNF